MRLRRLIVACVVLALLALAGQLWLGHDLSRPRPARLGAAPADLGATAVVFPSASGSAIHGWLSADSPRSVLLLPGVRANRLSMLDRARLFRDHGYSVLLVDFQATGESPGDAITFGWRERLDVLAAVAFLRKSIPGTTVGVLGTSLGGAAALLATPPLDVDALVVEAVYPTIDQAVANRLQIRLGKAGRLLARPLLWQLRFRLGVRPEELQPVDHVSAVTCPILVIGGSADRHTTASETLSLFAAARDPKELWLVPAAAHVDFYRFAPEEYERRVLPFFYSTLRNE